MAPFERPESAKDLLGEDYSDLLKTLEDLLAKPASAPDLLDVLTPAVSQALTRERKARAHAAQAKGIAEAQARSITFGRPKIQPPPNFASILDLLAERKITHDVAAKMCGVGVRTFYRMRRDWLEEKQA